MQQSTDLTESEPAVLEGRIDRTLSVLDRIQSAAGFAGFAALTVVVTLQVLTRFVFHQPLLWSEEVARFLLFWLVLNGAALAVRRERHFVIEIFSGASVRHHQLRVILQLLPLVCILLCGIVMVIYGLEYAYYGSYRVMPISGINMMYIYLAIPVSGALMAVYSSCYAFQLILAGRGAKESKGDKELSSGQ